VLVCAVLPWCIDVFLEMCHRYMYIHMKLWSIVARL
jgi:hypothetical protein